MSKKEVKDGEITVAQLIRMLKKLPQDSIVLQDDDGMWRGNTRGVKTIDKRYILLTAEEQ